MMKVIVTKVLPYLLVGLALLAPCHNLVVNDAIAETTNSPSTRPTPAVHYDFGAVKSPSPKCGVECAVLIDYDNSKIMYAKNADEIRSIASISKLMTAMVVLDSKIDLMKTETISKEDALNSSKSRLRVGTIMSLNDLLHASLMQSDNRATRALARAVMGSDTAFATLMNLKARDLGLAHTHFNEPTGLDSGNVSSALEVAQMLHNAYNYKLIAQITAKKTYQCRVLSTRRKAARSLNLHNTNALISSNYRVLAGKTGFINAAAHCLTTLVQNDAGNRLLLVVLGAPSSQSRFREARKLVKWGFDHPL